MSIVAIVLVSGATLGETPFSVINLLWVNMVMDTLAAISLCTEPPHPTELKKERVKKHDKIILKSMWRSILGHFIYQFLVMLTLLYFGPLMFDINYDYIYEIKFDENGNPSNRIIHYSLMIITFMMMQLFNQINCRRLGVKAFNVFEDFFNNWLFIFILIGEFCISWAMILFGGKIFQTAPLTWQMVIAAFSFGIGSLLIGAGLKATPEQLIEKIPELLNENSTDG